ncbi:hypothetical protein AB6A40_009967 [Gnathostoma spinigerum]|uniref:Uncharacterized protein n=1 Tax=Gnathostoma spinigerum TaxID=75299 RepID=A0ABD6ETH8_9BILA
MRPSSVALLSVSIGLRRRSRYSASGGRLQPTDEEKALELFGSEFTKAKLLAFVIHDYSMGDSVIPFASNQLRTLVALVGCGDGGAKNILEGCHGLIELNIAWLVW